jgi:hypothetical protein
VSCAATVLYTVLQRSASRIWGNPIFIGPQTEIQQSQVPGKAQARHGQTMPWKPMQVNVSGHICRRSWWRLSAAVVLSYRPWLGLPSVGSYQRSVSSSFASCRALNEPFLFKLRTVNLSQVSSLGASLSALLVSRPFPSLPYVERFLPDTNSPSTTLRCLTYLPEVSQSQCSCSCIFRTVCRKHCPPFVPVQPKQQSFPMGFLPLHISFTVSILKLHTV